MISAEAAALAAAAFLTINGVTRIAQ